MDCLALICVWFFLFYLTLRGLWSSKLQGEGWQVANKHHPQTPAFLSQLICIRLPLCLQSNLTLWKFGVLSSGMAGLIHQPIRLTVLELEGLTPSLATCFVGSCASSILHRGWVLSCHLPSAQEQFWQGGGGRHHGWIFPAFVLFPRKRQKYQQQGEASGELLFQSGKQNAGKSPAIPKPLLM